MPNAHPATPTPSATTTIPMLLLLETVATYQVFTVGAIAAHTKTTKRVLPTPAKKLLRWVCKDGK